MPLVRHAPNPLGDLLRERRRAKRIGFKQLSAATDLEPETLRKWEVGETYDVPLRGVLIYARIVGITLDELARVALGVEFNHACEEHAGEFATPPEGSGEAFGALDARRAQDKQQSKGRHRP